MTRKSKQKSTQDYTLHELYKGDCKNVFGFDHVKFPKQENTEVQVALLKGQEISSFIINRLRKDVSKNGIPWSKWELWGQVIISVKPRKNGTQRLNIYGKHRNPSGSANAWSPFYNMTNNPNLLMQIVKEQFLNDFNEEINRLVTANIGAPSVNIEEYLIEEKTISQEAYYSTSHPLVVEEDYVGDKKSIKVWVKKHNQTFCSYSRDNYSAYHYAQKVAYPGMEVMEVESVAPGLTMAMRETSPETIVKHFFGAKNYRKDLMKACMKEKDIIKMDFASSFRNVVPTDWIVKMINCDEERTFMALKNRSGSSRGKNMFVLQLSDKHKVALRSLFKSLTEAQKRRLVNQLCEPAPKPDPNQPRGQRRRDEDRSRVKPWMIEDSLRMWRDLTKFHNVSWAPGQLPIKSWAELHDYLDMDLRKRKNPIVPIPKVTLAKKIEKIAWKDDFNVIIPDTTHDLIEWGKDMNHCIGSYTREAAEGSSVFVALMQDDVMIGNAQINVKDKRLVQIFGKRNRILEKPILEKFSHALIEEKILPKDAFNYSHGFRLDPNPNPMVF